MGAHATGTFETKTWDEKTYSEVEGTAKLTRTTMSDAFHGDIEGEATVEYLMAYGDNGSATYVGLARVVGQLAGRSGSFVLRHVGTYADGTASGALSVVPGSGSGDLHGLRGEGGYRYDGEHGPASSYTLDYDFA